MSASGAICWESPAAHFAATPTCLPLPPRDRESTPPDSTPEIYTLALHDALPISAEHARLIAGTGGVIWPLLTLFVSKSALVDGMKQMVDAVGIDHVGFGSDLLGIPSRAFRSYADLPALAAE